MKYALTKNLKGKKATHGAGVLPVDGELGMSALGEATGAGWGEGHTTGEDAIHDATSKRT